MKFISWDLAEILERLHRLQANSPAQWGKFTAQHMVEHLCGGLSMSMGHISFPGEVSEEKAQRLKNFLSSDQPFAKEIQVGFVVHNAPLKHEELDLAIDDLVTQFLAFEEYYEQYLEAIHPHPYFGKLNYAEWKQLHIKHFTHHFEQFGI
jgi:hydroxymethylglutaryl-CoA reductase